MASSSKTAPRCSTSSTATSPSALAPDTLDLAGHRRGWWRIKTTFGDSLQAAHDTRDYHSTAILMPDGRIVWEYVNPFFGGRPNAPTNEVFRALRYSAEEIERARQLAL